MDEQWLEERLTHFEGQMNGLALLFAVVLEERGDRDLNQRVRDRARSLVDGFSTNVAQDASTSKDFDLGTVAFLNRFVNFLRP